MTTTPDSDEAATILRKRNRRLIRLFVLVLACAAAILSLRRLYHVAMTHPAKRKSTTNTIPGYFTEEEVTAFIHKGISITSVFARFGQPHHSRRSQDGGTWHSYTAEKYPRDRIYDYAFNGFAVLETNGHVRSWTASHMSTAR